MKTDNSTANGFIRGTIKQNKTKAIDMRFYWLKDRQEQQQFDIHWAPGQVNLADYFTKHHPPTHHRALRPIYLFDNNKQLDMQGCIKILHARLGKKISPVPRAPHTSSFRLNKQNAPAEIQVGFKSKFKSFEQRESLKLADTKSLKQFKYQRADSPKRFKCQPELDTNYTTSKTIHYKLMHQQDKNTSTKPICRYSKQLATAI